MTLLDDKFVRDGFLLAKNVVCTEYIEALRGAMVTILEPYMPDEFDVACSEKALDSYFYQASSDSIVLKNNAYKLFGKLSHLPGLLCQVEVTRVLQLLGFENFTVQGFSVFCLEPGNTRNKFRPHQDLRGRTSHKSLILWVPLSVGSSYGGVRVWKGSHALGPLQHSVDSDGHLTVDSDRLSSFEQVELTDFALGDALFINPYSVHETVLNLGDGIRWTAIVKIDDIKSVRHLDKHLSPFPEEELIDLRSNEDRLLNQ